MQVVQFIRTRMLAYRSSRAVSDAQDLVLYRQLRRAENRLYDVRDRLARALETRKGSADVHTDAPQSGGGAGHTPDSGTGPFEGAQAFHPAVCRQQDRAFKRDEIPEEEIAFLKRELNRLETEYQTAQMNVRTYFYLESCPGRLLDAEVTAGQPAQ